MKKLFALCFLLSWFLVAQTTPAGDYQISGIVVDHLTNRPLNHVLVQIIRTGKGGGDASVLTEADGRFVFVHVPPGKYQLSAEKRSQQPEGFHSDGGYSTAIVVDGKQKTDGIVFAMRTDAAIGGVVLSDDGEPVRNAQVILFEETVNDGEPLTRQSGNENTNSAGQFHFAHLAQGKYYIAVQATPWFAQGGNSNVVYPVTFYGDTTDGSSASAVVLPEGGSGNVQINLHTVPGIRVKLAEPTRGFGLFVPGPGGSRVPVPAIFTNGGMGGMLMQRGRGARFRQNSVIEGQPQTEMEISNIAAGRYEVVVYGDNGGFGGEMQTVDLADGGTLSLRDASPSTIVGTVLFAQGRPKNEIQVILAGGQRGAMSEVGPDGSFKFEKVSAGKFEVYLNNQDVELTSISAKGAQVVRDSLEVPAGAAVELLLRAENAETLVSLEGFAVKNGSAVPGAMVLLLPEDFGKARLMRRDQSDADGSFSLPRVLPGRYKLLAIDDGRDLAYKSEAVIKPYLTGALSITVPLKSNNPIQVPIQARKR